MDIHIFEQLGQEGAISTNELDKVKTYEKSRLISVHWDLRILLYFSVLLLSSGLGIFLYKNVDAIGHTTLVTLTGILAGVCFFYCFKHCAPYSNGPVTSPGIWFDYILLLGCLLMLAFIGYIQYQYHVFGMRWGLATFIPMLFLFFCAYYFDHKGVLSLAITNLGAWLGIAVQPMKLLSTFDHDTLDLIVNGIILGSLLHALMWLSRTRNIKPHFVVVYKNFGVHVLLISLLAGMSRYDSEYFLWFLIIMAVIAYHIREAFAQSSMYFMVVAILYGYYAISYVVVRFMMQVDREGDLSAYITMLYFIGSGIGLVLLLIRLNRQLKKRNDSIQ